MKTILVPTDFSETADNALNYAIEIAKITKAKIILLHIYNFPIVASESPVLLPPIYDIEKECMKDLEILQQTIYQKHNHTFEVECKCEFGLAVDEINVFAENNKIDFIIMGMQGGGYFIEKIIGSITTTLFQKAKCPVLAIDNKVKFKSIKKIVLAFDYLEIADQTILEPLKEFVRIFNSHVYVLNIVNELEIIPPITKTIAALKLEHALEDIIHTFHFQKNDNIIDGINDFITEQNMDMVAMIPRVHSAIRNLFKEPQTKKMAFHTTVPLLAIHE